MAADSKFSTENDGFLWSGKVTTDPIFVLAPPCSSAAAFAAMLGRHPQLYDLPELHLFLAETMADWSLLAENASFHMDHGLLRVIAQVFYGAQTEATIRQAKGWLRRRRHFSTGLILETLALDVYPLILIYTSSSIVRSVEFLDRAYRMFSDAKFIFVSEHPTRYCRAVLDEWTTAKTSGEVPDWLRKLAFNPHNQQIDPQWTWLALCKRIWDFIEPLPDTHKLHIRFDDLVANPEALLHRVAAWIGLRTTPETVASMQHPEGSVYACYGPCNAVYGNSPALLRSPGFSTHVSELQPLTAPLAWLSDSEGFSAEVVKLAEILGYS